jgi:hydroxymethylpyrimidine/phosphomethylpyrimidine kinase
MKGGHIPGEALLDLLLTRDGGVVRFEGPRIETRHTHGTGCTLASACAVLLSQGHGLEAAAAQARAYVQGAIRAAPGLGAGSGPLGHGWRRP